MQKYDLIFSIGEACSCTSALRRAKLQFASYPFDWLWGADFIRRCKIVASRFSRFIDKKDLEDTHQTNLDKDNLCEIYHNKYNDLTFNHDFAAGRPLNETYQDVSEKYARRISRLLETIDKSQRILLVCIETPVKNHSVVDNNDLIRGRRIIADAFPNTDIDLLYFSNSDNKKQTEKVSEHIIRVYDDYKDKASNVDYAVCGKVLLKHLRNIKLKLPLSVRFKLRLEALIINSVPFKNIRHNLQRKYHVK